MAFRKRHICITVPLGAFFIIFLTLLSFHHSVIAAQGDRCTVTSPCVAYVSADEFNSIKAFSRVNVGPLRGSAENLGLIRSELTEYVQELFSKYFIDIDLNEKLFPFSVDEPRELGYIRFTVRTVEDDDPVILHILLRSGNYALIGKGIATIQIYDEDMLQLSSKENIDNDVKQLLEEMIKDLARNFHDARR
ncbi:hypothetical protein [Desulfonatronum parangueonense]